MVTAKNPVGDLDIIQASAATYYGPGVTLKDLDGLKEEYELNSNIVKDASGKLVEIRGAWGTRLGTSPRVFTRFDREDHRAPKCSLCRSRATRLAKLSKLKSISTRPANAKTRCL